MDGLFVLDAGYSWTYGNCSPITKSDQNAHHGKVKKNRWTWKIVLALSEIIVYTILVLITYLRGYRMNITRAILLLRIKYAKRYGYNPTKINSGSCMNFADDIVDMGFHDCQAVWGDTLHWDLWSDKVRDLIDFLEYFASGHCFIWYDGRFYDSECPQGCNYPDGLPFYQRSIAYCEKYF